MNMYSRMNDRQAVPGRDAKKVIEANNSNILKFKKRRNDFKPGRGLIYLGRIPHGFYEDQMTAYFNQFGKVISAVIPRSEKSGRSKGYGYVEFEDEEVAKIAAEAMNNYLMYNKIIKCRYIPPEERRKSGILRAKTMHTCPGVLRRIKNANEKRESLSKLNLSAYQKKTQKKIAEFKKFFEERGIDFNFKIDINNSKDVNSGNDSEKDEIKKSNNADEGMEEIEDQFGVLEIDASDGEIHFKIPPQVKKVIKKSSSSVIAPKGNSKMKKKLKTKKPKKSNLKKPEQIIKPKERTKRATKSLENRLVVKEETLKRVLKKDKHKPLKKRNDTVLNQKKLGIKVTTGTLKKEKSNMQPKSTIFTCGKLSSQILSGEKK